MKQTIRVFADARHSTETMVEADVKGGLAIYKDIIYHRGWALVHVASKNPLCYPLQTKARATKLRAALLVMGDWAVGQCVMDASGGVIREHYDEIRAALEAAKEVTA